MQLTWSNTVKALTGIAAATAILCSSGRAEAAPYTHDGFYLQLNAGLGYMNASAEQGGITQKLYGATLPSSLLLGGTVGPVVIGGGFFADHAFSPGASVNGQKVSADYTMTLIGIGAFADIYPDVHKGLHFQPFIGWGGLERSVNGNSGGSDPTGIVLAIGGGYDFFVSDNWSIGGMARLAYAPLKMDDVSVGVFAPSLLATFTYH
ncbi:MAG TPA: hypothetical protein VER11_16450 [Polyangiaceae bacterium]|nr:hypothetical protein [Polyangiaceae bacterium]